MRRRIREVLDLLFPRRCVMCGNRLTTLERSVCTSCYVHLPFTNYHTVEHSPLEKMFWEQIPIERATSVFHYDGEDARRIIHSLKYNGRPEVGYDIAFMYAKELEEHGFFDSVDCIIPIPLHRKRQMKRKYNQSLYVAKGISRATGIPIYNNVVKRVINNPTQTGVNASERRDNVSGIFCLKDKRKVEGKHILLVDDVTTTGATITSCAKELTHAPDTTFSVFTLALGGRVPVPALSEVCED